MANFIDKTLDFFKLSYDDVDEDDLDYDYEDPKEEEKKPKKEPLFGHKQTVKEEKTSGGMFSKSGKSAEKDKPIPAPSKVESRANRTGSSGVSSVVRGGNRNMESEIVSIRPKDDSARLEIADNLLQRKTVLINMETLDLECAQRIVDFTAGVCYAIKGDMRFPSKYLVVAVPDEVELTGKYEDAATK